MTSRFATDVAWPHRTSLQRTARSLKEYRKPIVVVRCHGGDGRVGTGTLLAVVVSEREPTVAGLLTIPAPAGVLVTPHDLARLERGGTTQVWCPRCRVGHVLDLARTRDLVARLRQNGAPVGGWPYRVDVELIVVQHLVD